MKIPRGNSKRPVFILFCLIFQFIAGNNLLAQTVIILSDDFTAGVLDGNKWLKGMNAGNQATLVNGALQLSSQNSASAWVVTKNKYAARNTTTTVKFVQPGNDNNLGFSPTYNLSSTYGIFGEANWYRFYVYRSGSTGPYRLYAQWKKNNVEGGFDVTGNLTITNTVYLRLRFDNTNIHFEASLDGLAWTDTYTEVFGLPGYTLDSSFNYELAAYSTPSKGLATLDDFVITNNNVISDTQPPVISSVAANNLASASATIIWSTNEASDSQVEYGLTTSYGTSTPLSTTLVTSHAAGLSGLNANTLYHYRVKSKDAAGNLATSGDFTFTTPSFTVQFVDITASAGVAGIPEYGGHAILFADVNGDERLDMYVTHTNFVPTASSWVPGYDAQGLADFLVLPDELYINNGNNTFTENAVLAGVDDPGESHGAIFVDIDHDGDYDLFNGQRGPSGNRLYVNNGNGTFTEVTAAAGILPADRRTIGTLALDIDNDGDMDLFSANWGVGNEMYVNDGSGHFTVENRGVTDIDPDPNGTMSATAADVDNDGDMDIFMAKRIDVAGDACKLYINDGSGYFTDQAASRGVAFIGHANGAIFVDLEWDGDLDLLLAASGIDRAKPVIKLGVYRNQGNGMFVDETNVHNIPFDGYTLNAGDLDNDGDLDIFTYINSGTGQIWLNNGAGSFTAQTNAGFSHVGADVRAASLADTDNDGDLDVAFTEINAPTSLYRNVLINGMPAQNYLQIKLTGADGRVGLFGSKFYLYEAGHLDDPAYLLGYQQLTSVAGTLSQNAPIIHFGVSPVKNYDLRIKMLDGNSIVQASIAPGQRLNLQAPPDVTPPVISSVSATNVTTSSATIGWSTNEASDTQVEYGLTTSYGASTALSPALVTSHTVALTGLQSNTTYHYRVKSKDAAGNLATSGDFTFTTSAADVTPPVISSVSATNVTTASATISWSTNEASDTQVEYGLTTSYGASTALSPALVTSHTVALTGLQSNTTYHYRVKSRDAAGNLAMSGDFILTTLVLQSLDVTLQAETMPVKTNGAARPPGWVLFEDGYTAENVNFPGTGTYDFTLRAFGKLAAGEWSKAEIRIDQVAKATIEINSATYADFLASFTVSAGTHQVAVAFINDLYSPPDDRNLYIDWLRVKSNTPADTQPPVISSVSATNVTATSATIGWNTNEASDTQVEYGLTTSYGTSTPLNTALVTSHAAALMGLQSNTTYHYRVKSRDATGNLATSSDFTLTTNAADVTPPVISSVSATNVTTTSATIGWNTNEASDSQVEYGLTTSYGASTSLNTTLVTSHSMALMGLQANTLYHYRVKSKDAAGNLATSADFTFTTLAPDVTPPVISSVTATGITTSAATITWSTNEASDSQVEYGLTTSYGTSTPLNTALVTNHNVALTGLQSNTTYHYRVKSRDAAGNLATSGDLTLTTLVLQSLDVTLQAETMPIKTNGDARPPGWVLFEDGYVAENVNFPGTGTYDFTLRAFGKLVAGEWSKAEIRIDQVAKVTIDVNSPTYADFPASFIVTAGTHEVAIAFINDLYSPPNDRNLYIDWLRVKSNTPADTQPPVISSVTATNVNTSVATITWSTDEASDTQVEYGLTTSYGASTPLNTTLLTNHAVSLTSLQANTLYYYRVKSKDAAGNLATSADFTFTTLAPDVTPPVISSVTATGITTSAATITWSTNEASDSQVEYGLTTSYGASTSLNTTLLTNHSVSLSNLQANMLYHYRVKSKDAAGNLATSADFTFTTLANLNAIALYTPFEVSLSTATVYGNPYSDISVTGVFTAPSGRVLPLKGFWDGGQNWLVRFSPDETGLWQYQTQSVDPELVKAGTFTAVANPAKRGFVRVSAARPYQFEYSDGTPFLLMGDTNWDGMSSGVGLETRFKPYINLRASQNFNAYHTIVVHSRYDYQANEGGVPFAMIDETTRNYDSLNPGFFQWVDKRVAYADSMGVTSILFVSWAYEIAKMTTAQYDRLTQYLVARYAAYNVFWVLAGDYQSSSVTATTYRQIGQAVANADPYDHPLTIHPSDGFSNREFANDAWLSYLMHQIRDAGEFIADSIRVDRVYNKPVVNGEYGYHQPFTVFPGHGILADANYTRTGGWSLFGAGGYFIAGFLHTFLDPDGHYPYDPGFDVLPTYWDLNDPLDLEAARQYSVFHQFFRNNTAWQNLAPHPEWVLDRQTELLATPGVEYVAYHARGGRMRLQLPAGYFSLAWFDPITGALQPARVFQSTGESVLLTPVDTLDAAALIRPATTPALTYQGNVTNLQSTQLNIKQMRFTWQTPVAADSRIDLQRPDGSRVQFVDHRETTAHALVVDGLTADVNYTITVSSQTANGLEWRNAPQNLTTTVQVMDAWSEAENLPVKTNGHAEAPGWNLNANGHIATMLTFPQSGSYAFTIRARGECRQSIWPNLTLELDGAPLASWTINSAIYKEFVFSGPVGAGAHEVKIVFTNAGNDRQLIVDYLHTQFNDNTDTQPPVISNVAVNNISTSAATISWSTDEASDSQVEYGLTTNYGVSTALSTTLFTNHTVALTGLQANTLYHYRVKSRDAAGNLATSGDFTFTTAAAGDVTAPIISGVAASNISTSTATISWSTNEASDSQVEYGLTTSYGASTSLSPTLLTNHSVSLSNLQPNTLYHYRAKSRDASGNLATSGDFTLTTAAAPQNFDLTLQAENMPIKTNGDARPPGWVLFEDGYLAQNVNFAGSGLHQFTLHASGKYAAGEWSQAELRIDQVTRAVVFVEAEEYADFTAEFTVTAGTHEVAVAFVNDYFSPPDDRNLYVDWLRIQANGINPGDVQPPTISGVAANSVTTTGANIVWTTDEGSDSQVEYGLTSGYGTSTALNTALLTAHAITLAGLLPNTTYHYRVKSKDAAGNLATSNDLTFTTAATVSGHVAFANIQDIFSANCVRCHQGTTAPGGLALLPEQAHGNIVNVASTEYPQWQRVQPGNRATSWLYEKISNPTPAVGSRMGDLTADEIELIGQWIDQGATETPVPPYANLEFRTTAVGNAEINIAYFSGVVVWGGLPPYQFNVIGGILPPGLTLDSGSGMLVGMPNTVGSYDFTLRVSDGQTPAATLEQIFHIEVFNTQDHWLLPPGFVIENVVSDLHLPVNIAFVPNPGPNPTDPYFYVTLLYGDIIMVQRNFQKQTYATGLLNFVPTGVFPGSGEMGVTGIAVDPASGDVFASMVYEETPGSEDFRNKVVRFHSTDAGRTAATQTTILSGFAAAISHQIQEVTIGTDGKVYVNTGDGWVSEAAPNINDHRGKVLRLNLDGSVPEDNPFPGNITFATGFRNPFGAAWRQADGKLYVSDNGQETDDRIAKVVAGDDYGWGLLSQDLTKGAIFLWNPTVAPVAMDFLHNNSFPSHYYGNLFAGLSGPPYLFGATPRGKKIQRFVLDPNGQVVSDSVFLDYIGAGAATVIGVAFGEDGLYFTDLYGENGFDEFGQTHGNIYRIRSTAAVDTTRPVISNVQTTNITGTSATIVWQTNEAANRQVEFGVTTNYGISTALDLTLSTTHNVTLSDLTPETTYHFRVKSADAANNSSVSGDFIFTTIAVDNTPPVISAVQVDSITVTGAVMKWTTNEPAASFVDFGLTNAYGATVSNAAFATSHRLVLSGLADSTLYHFRVRSLDASGNAAASPDGQFTTRHLVNTTLDVTLEAENMPIKTNGDARPPGWALFENGYIAENVSFPAAGVYQFTLRARGMEANGEWSMAELWIDQVPRVTLNIDNGNYTDFMANFTVPAGMHEVAIAFINDIYDPPLNRNLYVDWLHIQNSSTAGGAVKAAAAASTPSAPPEQFILQNFPNPFNAATRIRFALPRAAEVEVKIFDVAGRELNELVNGERATGHHEVLWNGRGRNGEELSSGVYLVRLRYRAGRNGSWSQLLQRVLLVK